MTMRKLEWAIAKAVEDMGGRPIAETVAPNVLRCGRKLEACGTHETARRLRSTIGMVFRFAICRTVDALAGNAIMRQAGSCRQSGRTNLPSWGPKIRGHLDGLDN
jgi:hypothetical protein